MGYGVGTDGTGAGIPLSDVCFEIQQGSAIFI